MDYMMPMFVVVLAMSVVLVALFIRYLIRLYDREVRQKEAASWLLYDKHVDESGSLRESTDKGLEDVRGQ